LDLLELLVIEARLPEVGADARCAPRIVHQRVQATEAAADKLDERRAILRERALRCTRRMRFSSSTVSGFWQAVTCCSEGSAPFVRSTLR
jgi:hypothetical protein